MRYQSPVHKKYSHMAKAQLRLCRNWALWVLGILFVCVILIFLPAFILTQEAILLFLLILLTTIIFAGLLFAIISQQVAAVNRTKPDALIHCECYFADISDMMRSESLISHFFRGTNPRAIKKGSRYYLLLESNYVSANNKLWKGQITGAHRKRSLRNVPKISLGQVIFNEIPIVGGYSKSAFSTLFLVPDVETQGTIERKTCRQDLLADAADVFVYGPYEVTYARLPEGVLFEVV